MIKIEKFEKAYFNIGNSEYYEGYHIKEKRWNGWAMPYFCKHIADLIAHNFSSDGYTIKYDNEKDRYTLTVEHEGLILDVLKIEKLTVDTNDGKKELYDFATLSWTWDSYTLDEVKSISNANIISNNNEIEKDNSMDIEY